MDHFTPDEIDEIENYISKINGLNSNASSFPSLANDTCEENDNDGGDDGRNETDYYRGNGMDREAIYYDLEGNIIYQPPERMQKDLSELLKDSVQLGTHHKDKSAWCLYYPNCRYGDSCRYRHPTS